MTSPLVSPTHTRPTLQHRNRHLTATYHAASGVLSTRVTELCLKLVVMGTSLMIEEDTGGRPSSDLVHCLAYSVSPMSHDVIQGNIPVTN